MWIEFKFGVSVLQSLCSLEIFAGKRVCCLEEFLILLFFLQTLT